VVPIKIHWGLLILMKKIVETTLT